MTNHIGTYFTFNNYSTLEETPSPYWARLLPGLIAIMLAFSSSSVMVAYAAKPTAITLAAENVTSTSAELYASINPGGKLTSWNFRREPPANCPFCVPPQWCGGTRFGNEAVTVHCTQQNLSPSTEYWYHIEAENADGSAVGNAVRFITKAASAGPIAKTLPASKITSTSAQLNAQVYHMNTPVDYKIRLASPGQDFATKCSGTIIPQMWPIGYAFLACPLTGLTPSTAYRYYVVAANTQGTSTGDIVSFTTLAAAVSTDWAVLSVGLNPQAPNAGDAVTFGMVMTALSSTSPFPQSVDVQCMLDGNPCGQGTVSYSGPQGTAFTVTTETPWAATIGTHKMMWSISGANDPNPANNMMSTTFTVTAQTQTTAETQTETTPTSQTSIQTTSQTQTVATTQLPATTQTVVQTQLVTQPQNVAEGFLDMLQENSLLVMGLLALLLVLAVVFAIRKRRSGGQRPPQPPAASPSLVGKSQFCGQCGSENATASKYCRACGHKFS